MKIIIKKIKKRLLTLMNPEQEFKELKRTTLEQSVSEYLKSLLLLCVLTGAYIFVTDLAKVFYFSIFNKLEVNYLFMLNYLMGKITSTMFFYLFAGTFIVFFISIILRIFLRKIKYMDLLQIIFMSLTPVLLFGWITQALAALFIWSIFLLWLGARTYKEKRIPKKSIQNRN
jgi:hypothetical protein